MRHPRILVFALSVASALGSALLAAPPSFQTLDEFAEATGISADGSVVVGNRIAGLVPGDPLGGLIGPSYLYDAVRWEDGVTTGLEPLPGGQTDGGARGVSADGSVIVGHATGDGGKEAVLWQNGAITCLGVLDGFDDSFVCDVSADGSVAVGGASAGAGLMITGDAWRWDNGVMSGLGVGVAPPEWAVANAVSGDGGVVVGSRLSLGAGHSFRWDNGELTTLGRVSANGVSADGSVVVGGVGLGGQAWQWEDGVATDLGGMPGTEWGTALDVSADGSVIVGSVGGNENEWWDGSTLGVLWTPSEGARYVGDVLADHFGLDLDGWVLHEVVAISDDGLTIVGNATKDFEKAQFIGAWVAHIPEPGTLALLAVGALVWVGRGRSGATRISICVEELQCAGTKHG